jgi:N-acetyl sugar amidotransferase
VKYDNLIKSKSYLIKKANGSLEQLVKQIKDKGKKNKYDCIIGVSGGVDSTYTAYIARKLGLRPLAVHLDNGWNTELAVKNIENVLNYLNIDLYTHVLDWDEFKDIQLSFLRASTPDLEIPTDHAIHAVLYRTACKMKTKFILGGTNTATEGGGVAAWSQGHADWKYIRSINKLYGKKEAKSFPHYGPGQFIYYIILKKIKWISILDYISYEKDKAKSLLINELGWRDYGGKHYESVYTRFYQGFILPRKFGFDKRRLHLSSLIWSSQIVRNEAIEEILKNDYPNELQEQDLEFVVKKLQINDDEFKKILNEAPRRFWDYPSYKKSLLKYKRIVSLYHSITR